MGKQAKFNSELPFEPKHKLVSPERKEQCTLVDWSQYKPIPRDYMHSIPNEGRRTIQEGAMLKRMGLRPGVSDLFLAYPAHGKHGLWIEMKIRRGGVISTEQRTWINRMNAVGYVAVVAKGWEHAVQLIESYLDGTIEYQHEI